MEDGRVAGVRATDPNGLPIAYGCRALIVATGGFGANPEMLAQYRPELREAVTTNQPGTQGDGILFAQAIGADTVDIGEIQVHPTVEQATATLLSENIRGDGAILVNVNGERFTNELLTRDVVSQAEWDQPERRAFAVFDQSVHDNNLSIEEKFVARNLIHVADDFAGLAQMMGVPADTFAATVASYNENIANGVEDPLGRIKSLNPLVNPPYYALPVAPGVHHCMGGLRVNAAAEVLNAEGEAIPGLFAAGEVTGGIHGGNRLGGNAVCDINVNGRQAQRTACEYLDL